MRHSLLAVAAATALLAGAPAAPVPKERPKRPLYFPTTVGTKWVYEQKEYEMTLVVTKVEAADRGTLVRVENVIEGGKTIPIHTALVSEADVAWTEEAGQAYTPPWQLLRLHQPDGKWETTSTRKLANGNLTLHGAMSVRGGEEVRVPAGTFKAVRVVSDWSMNGQAPRRQTRWFAHGVGVVKEEFPNTVRVLKSFTPGRG